MKRVYKLLFAVSLPLLFSGCYLHMGWGTPVVVNNQMQQPQPQIINTDSGYYRE